MGDLVTALTKETYFTKLGEIPNSVNLLEIEREDNSIALWPTVSLITAGDRISIYSVNKPSMLVGNCGLPYPCPNT